MSGRLRIEDTLCFTCIFFLGNNKYESSDYKNNYRYSGDNKLVIDCILKAPYAVAAKKKQCKDFDGGN